MVCVQEREDFRRSERTNAKRIAKTKRRGERSATNERVGDETKTREERETTSKTNYFQDENGHAGEDSTVFKVLPSQTDFRLKHAQIMAFPFQNSAKFEEFRRIRCVKSISV